MQVRVVILGITAALAIVPGVPATALGQSEPTDPERWIEATCTEYLDWVHIQDDADAEIADVLAAVEDGSLTTREAKTQIVEASQRSRAASADQAKAAKSSGAPDVNGGRAVAKRHVQLVTAQRDAEVEAADRLSKLKTKSPRSFVAKASAIQDDAAAAIAEIGFLEPLDAPSSLAFRFGTTCPSLWDPGFEPGDCVVPVRGLAPSDASRFDWMTVECASPHDAEFFSNVDNPPAELNEPFPGTAAIDEAGDRACANAFERFVGVAFNDQTSLGILSYFPDETSWYYGDRALICALGNVDGADLVGSRQAG